MLKVEFEEFQPQINKKFNNTSKLSRWVIKLSGGLIKDHAQAQFFLFFLFIVFVVLIFFITFSLRGNKLEENFVILPQESVGSPQGLPK